MRKWSLLLTSLVLFGGDALSKAATVWGLPPMHLSSASFPYGGIGVFRNFLGVEFSLCYTTNTGAAWGMFANWQMGLLAVRICLILAIATYVVFYVSDRRLQVPFVLVLTGALGNVIDYFIYGHVIDMIHFVFWGYDFPVFNLADSYITLGVGSLMALSLFIEQSALGVDCTSGSGKE